MLPLAVAVALRHVNILPACGWGLAPPRCRPVRKSAVCARRDEHGPGGQEREGGGPEDLACPRFGICRNGVGAACGHCLQVAEADAIDGGAADGGAPALARWEGEVARCGPLHQWLGKCANRALPKPEMRGCRLVSVLGAGMWSRVARQLIVSMAN